MRLILAGALTAFSWFIMSAMASVSTGEGRLVYFRSDYGITESGPLPQTLDPPELLQWRIELDSGHSPPIACGDRIFLTDFNERKEELATLALSMDSGKILWKQVVPAIRIEQFNRLTGNAAQASPACDGSRVYVFFGSYGLVCYDLDGKQLWEHRMGPFQDEYGSASSPVGLDGVV